MFCKSGSWDSWGSEACMQNDKKPVPLIHLGANLYILVKGLDNFHLVENIIHTSVVNLNSNSPRYHFCFHHFYPTTSSSHTVFFYCLSLAFRHPCIHKCILFPPCSFCQMLGGCNLIFHCADSHGLRLSLSLAGLF